MTEYIERSAALLGVNEFYHDPKVDIVLEEIPAADVEPVRHGRWLYVIEHEDRTMGTCSCCMVRGVLRIQNNIYCPNCGAKMDIKS